MGDCLSSLDQTAEGPPMRSAPYCEYQPPDATATSANQTACSPASYRDSIPTEENAGQLENPGTSVAPLWGLSCLINDDDDDDDNGLEQQIDGKEK
jgi:hypothetical protein